MITCPECGKQLPEGSRFCKFCGKPITIMPPQSPVQRPMMNNMQQPVRRSMEGVAQNNIQKSVPHNNNNNKSPEKNKKSAKGIILAIIAVILVIAIVVTGWFLWDHFGKNNEENLSEKEKLTKILEESTTKPIVEFAYDDYDSDGTYEAYAVVGKTADKDEKHPEFYDADIYFVNTKKAQPIKENISGQVNGKIKLEGTKYISIEVYEDGKETGKSFIYSAKGTKVVEPDLSGKYSRVRFEDGKLVADDENGKKIEVDINGNKLTVDFDPAVYEDTVLAQYRRVLDGEFNSLSDNEKNLLNEELLFMYENGNKFHYALYDIDKNGVDELFISYTGMYSAYGNVYAMYTYADGDVHYLSGSSYKYWLYPQANGYLVQHYNYGTGSSGVAILTIMDDGYTIEEEVYIYYIYDMVDNEFAYYKNEEVISESEYNSLRAQYGLNEYLSKDSDIDFDWIELTPDENSVSNQTSIPADAVEYDGNYYKVFKGGTYATFEEAAEYCKSLGGHLATIATIEENNAVYQIMIDSGFESAYFGLTCIEDENYYKWENNENIVFTNWAPNEPNSYSEKYGMFYFKFTDGTWNDGDFGYGTAGDDANFICEWEGN